MAYSPEIRRRAFVLYCEGLKLVEIAKRLKISRPQTLTAWKAQDEWDEKRKEVERRADEKVIEKLAQDTAALLLSHEEAGRGLRGLALRGLAAVARSTDGPDPEDPTHDAKAPDGLELQRFGGALKTAIQIERQARGLPTDGVAPDKNPLDDLDPTLILALYSAAKEIEAHENDKAKAGDQGGA